MGEVYRARDLRRDFAIKCFRLLLDPEALRRFEQEALATPASEALLRVCVAFLYFFGRDSGGTKPDRR
jgi:hypothetical protein